MGSDFRIARGTRLGSFRLVAPLGEGAMGRVWRAEGPNGPAALKLLVVESDEVRERFEREARVLLTLRHPNVVRAIDYGQGLDGTPFMVMELLDGEGLDDRIGHDGRFDVDEVVRIGCAAAAGLAAAHERGIIHRDVKPGNIFLCADGSVKVLDFGIAYLGSESDGRMPISRLTQPGTMMGTPSYMAPEQARGDGSEDVRTDVWGLGAVLYHALAGREPFVVEGNYFAELTRILTEDPDPLPDDVPPHVTATVLRALQKLRDDRFQSMAEMARALRDDAAPPSLRGLTPMAQPLLMAEEVRLVTAAVVEGLEPAAHDAFVAAVQRHGGMGSPLRGGDAVAVFGGDAWLGDEAERAVRMALEVRALCGRIGVGTGKALRRLDRGGALTGQAVAAAQQALRANDTAVVTLRPPSLSAKKADRVVRGPGVVAVCPETTRRIQGGFEMVAGRVIGIRPGGRALRPREVGGHEIPFAGRAEELATLVDLVLDVDEQERAAAVVLSGAPGIGKSRLRFELLRTLAEESFEVRVLEARGELAHGGASFGAVRELLRRHAEIPEGTDPAAARAKIEAMVASAELEPHTARSTADFVGELIGVPFADNHQLAAAREDPRVMADRIRLACADLFEGWTRQDLVLVMVEDAQWADDASLALLDALLGRLADRRLCIVATARPAFFVEHEALAGARRIELTELGDEETATIVERILGRAEPLVVERAAGNPYLAEELSLAVRDGADPGALPLTVEGAVLARLDKLAPDEKDLLKRAAVLGRGFWREALEALGEPLAGDLLRGLRRRELVVPHPSSRLAGCEEWLFRQAIVYEVCRGLLTDRQRAALHKAAASWLSRRGDAAPEEVARHFDTAGEADRALIWWIRAVHGAHGRGDSKNAARLAARVLELGTRLPLRERFAMHLVRCEAWYWLGEGHELERELGTADQIAEAHAQELGAAAIAQLRFWQSEHVDRSGHLEPAQLVARDAVRLADESAAVDLRVETRAVLSGLLAADGELEAAATIAGQALDIAKGGAGRTTRATAARALAEVEAQRGRLEGALFYHRMAKDLCLEVGDLRESTVDGIGMGEALVELGDYVQAERVLRKVRVTAQSLDLRTVLARTDHHLGFVAHRLGRHDEGLALEETAIAAARSLDDVPLVIAALACRATIFREAGKLDAALASADEGLALATGRGKRTAAARCHAARAAALLALGRHEEALTAANVARASADPHREVELQLVRHDALRALGRDEEAKDALRAADRALEARLCEIEDEALAAVYTTQVPANARLAGSRGTP